MDKKNKCTIVGGLVGGLLFFCMYLISMYTRLTAGMAIQMLVFPTLFGLAAGAVVGRELAASRQKKARGSQTYVNGQCASSVNDKVEQKKTDNVEEGVK